MFFHLHPRLPQEQRMSLKTFLNENLKNLRSVDNLQPDVALQRLEKESVYLEGASAALKAVGANVEQQLTDKVRDVFTKKADLIKLVDKISDEVDGFEDEEPQA